MRTHLIVVVMVAVAGASGCSGAPAALTFDGNKLTKARTATAAKSGVKAVTYTADGDEAKVREAKQRLTVSSVEKDALKTPEDLAKVVLDEYANQLSLEPWLTVTPTPVLACKVGRALQSGRFFVAVTSCSETKSHLLACADWDEVVPMTCSTSDEKCRAQKSAELCTGRLEKYGADLDAAAAKVAH